MRSLVVAFALMLAPLACGCVAFRDRNTVVPMAIDLPAGTPLASFQELVRRTQRLGYHVDFADARYGVFGMHTRAQLPRRGGPATLVVQCFADGHATVVLLGGTALDASERTRVSAEMRREAVTFVQALERGEP